MQDTRAVIVISDGEDSDDEPLTLRHRKRALIAPAVSPPAALAPAPPAVPQPAPPAVPLPAPPAVPLPALPAVRKRKRQSTSKSRRNSSAVCLGAYAWLFTDDGLDILKPFLHPTQLFLLWRTNKNFYHKKIVDTDMVTALMRSSQTLCAGRVRVLGFTRSAQAGFVYPRSGMFIRRHSIFFCFPGFVFLVFLFSAVSFCM